MITDAQREARKNGIFSSDAPKIMAGNGVRVVLEKLGEIEPENLDDVVEVQLGSIVEPRILDAYEVRFGKLAARSPDTMRHPIHTWLGAHLDGLLPSKVIEAKSVGWYKRNDWGDPGTDEVPERVMWQVQEQMAVAGCAIAEVPVCFVDEKSLKELLTGKLPPIELYIVPADRELEAYIVERCSRVWQHVQARTLPEPEKPIDARLLYRKDSGAIVVADEQIVALHAQLLEQQASEKLAKARVDDLKAQIQAFMKDASELRFNGRTLATWKKEKDRAAYTVAAREGSRKFLPKELK